MPTPQHTVTPDNAPTVSAEPGFSSAEPGFSPERPMRVLQVVHRFLPELGGTETHVAQVTERVQQRPDVDITVLTTDRSGDLPATELMNGVPVIRRRAWPRRRDYYFSPGLLKEIRSGNWDLVHFQGVHTLVPALGMLTARLSGIPFVLTFHSGGHSSQGRTSLRGLQFRLLTPLLRKASRLIAVSRFEKKRFSDATGIDPNRFVVIGNGGALPSSPTGTDRIPGRIVSSGRLEKYKGHHKAIEAMPSILKAEPNASLLILGSGPFEAELRAETDRLGLGSVVEITHLPPADRTAMATEMAKASVMAALSSYEAHPVGVMEAVASGLPVLGFDVAGIGDLVEDGLVEGIPGDATTEEIAAALVTMLRLADQSGPRVIPSVELPTWETCVAQLLDVYRDVLVKTVVAKGVSS